MPEEMPDMCDWEYEDPSCVEVAVVTSNYGPVEYVAGCKGSRLFEAGVGQVTTYVRYCPFCGKLIRLGLGGN